MNEDRSSYKIAFYCSSIARGGLELNFVRYARWMQELGWNVTVFCVAESPIHELTVKSGISVKLITRNRKYMNLVSAFKLARLFEQHSIDLCWFRDTRDFQILGAAKRFSRKPFQLLYQQAMQFGVSKKDIFHTLRFLPVDAWVSTLNFLAEQVKQQTKFPQERIHVIPLGVDDTRLINTSKNKQNLRRELGLPEVAFVAGIIGRIDPLKGQHTAIESIQHLHALGIKAHLLVVGETTLHEGNAYHDEIRSFVLQNNLTEFIHFRPYTEDVGSFYYAIDAFTLCSKGETFGTVTIEAMACSVPVIATNSSGSPEILDHGQCGMLFQPGDSKQLALLLEKLATDAELRKMLGAAGRDKFNREYSRQVSTIRLDRLLSSMLSV